MIHPIDVIQHKRDGLVLSDAEIQGFLRALVERRSPEDSPTDAQTSALLMAILIRGLNPQELAALTQAMRFSGETLDTSSLGSIAVDKHSTGGVGDKTSLLIAPIIAAAGAPAVDGEAFTLCDPMISGRSLGHTGGTLDKLESIPGFRTQAAHHRPPVRLRDGGTDADAGTRRPHSVRAARPHGNGRITLSDCGQHYEQEAGGGAQRAGPRREDRLRRIYVAL
jgi:pyrimidine-nucleoside phosphorylase